MLAAGTGGSAGGTIDTSKQGVTDGSDAPAGQIGEYIENWNSYVISTRLNESAWDGVPLDKLGTIGLSAGDWMVGEHTDVEQQPVPYYAPTTYVAAVLQSSSGEAVWYLIRGVTAWDLSVPIGPMRVNTAVPVQVTMSIEVVTTGSPILNPVNISSAVWARRMR